MKKVISKDSTQIAYDQFGHGPTLILVLGALNSRKSGVALAKLLASNFTVITYDRRGRGNSTNHRPYTVQREIEDISALLTMMGSPVFLYGHSSGAALALQASLQLGKQIKKLAIYEAPYAVQPKDKIDAAHYDQQLTRLLAAGRNSDAVALFIRNVGVSDKQLRALQRLPMWRGLVAMAPTLAHESAILGRGHAVPTARLKRLSAPTLVMHGGAGAPSMREAAQKLSAVLPKASLLTLDGQTHGVSPKALAPVLIKFFKAR